MPKSGLTFVNQDLIGRKLVFMYLTPNDTIIQSEISPIPQSIVVFTSIKFLKINVGDVIKNEKADAASTTTTIVSSVFDSSRSIASYFTDSFSGSLSNFGLGMTRSATLASSMPLVNASFHLAPLML